MEEPDALETEEALHSVLTSSTDRLFIVKFGAVWCRPCTDLQPSIDALKLELAETDRNAQVVLVDRTEDNDELFSKHNITKLPTVLLITNEEVRAKLPRPDPADLRHQVFSMLAPPALVLDADF
jgi:thioredoxin-like negative regulator of GroEL